jgi:hypothetical protein
LALFLRGLSTILLAGQAIQPDSAGRQIELLFSFGFLPI